FCGLNFQEEGMRLRHTCRRPLGGFAHAEKPRVCASRDRAKSPERAASRSGSPAAATATAAERRLENLAEPDGAGERLWILEHLQDIAWLGGRAESADGNHGRGCRRPRRRRALGERDRVGYDTRRDDLFSDR